MDHSKLLQEIMTNMVGRYLHDMSHALNYMHLLISSTERDFREHNSGIPKEAQNSFSEIMNKFHRLQELHSKLLSTYRNELSTKNRRPTFNIYEAILDVYSIINHRKFESRSKVKFTSAHSSLTVIGSIIKFETAMISLIDYIHDNSNDVIEIQLEDHNTHAIIKVIDPLSSIPQPLLKNIFELGSACKESNSHSGIHTCKTIVEQDLSGRLILEPMINSTNFIIKLACINDNSHMVGR
jgi:K+-sensing histidine kinase KdpD